jgi:Uma2 family endonuclease
MKTLYKWTVEDYHQIIESGVLEGKSVELLAGEILTMSPEKPIHSSRIDTVADYLRETLQGTAKVREAHPVTLDNSEPEPDIAIVCFDADNYATRHPYPQDIYWLIEVSNNTLNKDLEDKSIIYAQNGILEYWVIDLPHNKLWVFTQPDKNGYGSKQEIVLGRINPVSLPGISIEVSKLLPNK